MICKVCGKEIADGARFCSGCGSPSEVPDEPVCAVPETEEPCVKEAPPKISSHMIAAVVTTVLFGNWILGLCAIVFSRECEIAYEEKNYSAAARFSRRSLTFLCVGSALGFALMAFVALVLTVVVQVNLA